jgi:hypothetical protein
VSKLRWLILILGPLPIVGSSWAVSSWFRSEPRAMAARNDGLLDVPVHRRPTLARVANAVPIPDATGDLQQACRITAERLQERAGAAMRVIVRPPFVIGGDLSEHELMACHSRTIAPAVQAMQVQYFRSRPHQPVTVLLFSGETSYNRYSREWYGDGDVSVYGYYKPNERTLLVNHATGSGTLLHELTHALVDFEMADPPVWLNEGLASLHEQCRFRTDAGGPWIEGLVNWRLEGLQTVIRQGRLRSLAELVEEHDFRGPLVGTNYAQARYFCMYLQQQGRLAELFHDFRDHRAGDFAGSAAVMRATRGRSWEQLDRDFQAWVLALSP